MQDSTDTSLLPTIPSIPSDDAAAAAPSDDAAAAAPCDDTEALASTDTSPAHAVNSVDATTGQPIVARVNTRKLELETLLAALPENDLETRRDIELALATITGLMTGDLENIPSVVAVDLNRWLERNKHLAERATSS